MRIEAESIEEYFTKTGVYESELRQLDKIIRENAPDMKQVLVQSSYVGYGPIDYRPKSAKESYTWAILLIAAQKNNMALYACAVVDGQYIAEKYKATLGKVSCGKSCIRFKKLSDLDQSGLKKMIVDINKRYKSGEKLFGS